MSRHQKKKSNPWDPKLMAYGYKTAAEFFLKKNEFPVEIIFRLGTALLKRDDDKLSLMVEFWFWSEKDEKKTIWVPDEISCIHFHFIISKGCQFQIRYLKTAGKGHLLNLSKWSKTSSTTLWEIAKSSCCQTGLVVGVWDKTLRNASLRNDD